MHFTRLHARWIMIAGLVAGLLPITACDDHHDHFYDDYSQIFFANQCPAEDRIDISVNGEFACTATFGGESGCLVDVPPGGNSYYATGTTFNWGTNGHPIFIEVGHYETKTVNLRCD